MKIIFKKDAIKISDELSKHFKILLSSHGIKLKEKSLILFRKKILNLLGVD